MWKLKTTETNNQRIRYTHTHEAGATLTVTLRFHFDKDRKPAHKYSYEVFLDMKELRTAQWEGLADTLEETLKNSHHELVEHLYSTMDTLSTSLESIQTAQVHLDMGVPL